MDVIIDFILLPYQSIVNEEEFFKTWSYKDRKYS
jgi:hypothetical protein